MIQRRRFLACLLALAMVGCGHGNLRSQTGFSPGPADATKIAIVFVPGFKGSVLKTEAEGKTVWLTGPAAFGGNRSLRLEGEPLYAQGVLRRVDLIPHVVGIDAYGAWLNALERQFRGKATLVPFAYDWRQDNVASAQALAATIEKLHAQGFKKIWLIAHSMGGLVASYYLRYGAQDLNGAVENWQGAKQVDRVVFAGTPFRGTVEMFVDMQVGITTFRNRALLDVGALNSFPSCYELLPFPGSENIFLGTDTLQNPSVFDAEVWQQQGWGIFKTPCVDAPDCQHRLQHAQNQLRNAHDFLARINASVTVNPPAALQILNIFGEAKGTPERVYWNKPTHFYFRQNQMPSNTLWSGRTIDDRGDGLISVRSAVLPEAFAKAGVATEIRVTRSHGDLFRGAALQRQIFEFLERQHE